MRGWLAGYCTAGPLAHSWTPPASGEWVGEKPAVARGGRSGGTGTAAISHCRQPAWSPRGEVV